MTLQDAWTADELAANRRGELAASQLRKIRRRRTLLLVVASLVSAAVLVPIGYLYGHHDAHDRGVLMAVIAGAAVLGTNIYLALVFDAKFKHRRVTPLTGTVAFDATAGRRFYAIGGTPVRPLYDGLERMAGQTVIAYAIPESHIVVSVELATAA